MHFGLTWLLKARSRDVQRARDEADVEVVVGCEGGMRQEPRAASGDHCSGKGGSRLRAREKPVAYN